MYSNSLKHILTHTLLKVTWFQSNLGCCDWFVDCMSGDRRLKAAVVKVLSVLELVSVS